jgi:hypothetical protein
LRGWGRKDRGIGGGGAKNPPGMQWSLVSHDIFTKFPGLIIVTEMSHLASNHEHASHRPHLKVALYTRQRHRDGLCVLLCTVCIPSTTYMSLGEERERMISESLEEITGGRAR